MSSEHLQSDSLYPPRLMESRHFHVLARDYLDYLEAIGGEGRIPEVETMVPSPKSSLIGEMAYRAIRFALYKHARGKLLNQAMIEEPHKDDDTLEDYVRRRERDYHNAFDELVPLWADTHRGR